MKRYKRSLWNLLSEQEIGSLSLYKRIKIGIKLCEEVKKLVQSTLAHRDLKPSNIMVDYDDEKNFEKLKLVLVDFGIAGDWRDLEDSCGTPGFNAPEQFTCQKQWNEVDIFSLGKVLVIILFEWKAA